MNNRNDLFLEELKRKLSKRSTSGIQNTKQIHDQISVPPAYTPPPCPVHDHNSVPPAYTPPPCPVHDQISVPPAYTPPPCPVQDHYSVPPAYTPPPCPVHDQDGALFVCSPSPCPNDEELLGKEGVEILGRVAYRLKDFVAKGENLSQNTFNLPAMLDQKLSTLGEEKVSGLSDNGIALTIFIQKVMNSLSVLSQSTHVYSPEFATVIQKKHLIFSDVLYLFDIMRDCIVKPACNEVFKQRAIHCILLTLAYERLILSEIDISNIQHVLLAPMQRLTTLFLFARDALKDLQLLRNCKNISEADCQRIGDVVSYLQEFDCRSQCMALAVNLIKTMMDDVLNRMPKYKKYSEDKIAMGCFIEDFVCDIVKDVLEKEYQNPEELTGFIQEKIEKEFSPVLRTRYVTVSDNLYYDLKEILKSCQSGYMDKVKKLIEIDLFDIQENQALDDKAKLESMKSEIRGTYNAMASYLNSFFFPRQDPFADSLLEFMKNRMDSYQPIQSMVYEKVFR